MKLSQLCGLLLLTGTASFASVRSSSKREWFNHGTGPLKVSPPSESDLSSQSCASCHKAEYEDWKQSRHAQAWTNDIFQEGFLQEPQKRCIFCHAPLNEQFQAIRQKKSDLLVHEGVNCAACHVRDQTIISSKNSGKVFHSFEPDNTLKDPQFCAGCHQFNFNSQVNGGIIIEPLVVQDTYNEWLDYKSKGGQQTCQNCHMPEGRHIFRGAHDRDYLRKALIVVVKKTKSSVEFQVESKDVGHNFPTGDLFRHLTLEIKRPKDRDFLVVHSFGKQYKLHVDPKDGRAIQTLHSDTTIRPFKKSQVKVEFRPPFKYRVVYHYASPRNEVMSHLTKDQLVVELLYGELK